WRTASASSAPATSAARPPRRRCSAGSWPTPGWPGRCWWTAPGSATGTSARPRTTGRRRRCGPAATRPGSTPPGSSARPTSPTGTWWWRWTPATSTGCARWPARTPTGPRCGCSARTTPRRRRTRPGWTCPIRTTAASRGSSTCWTWSRRPVTGCSPRSGRRSANGGIRA
ncbi:MAG: Low molecular weight protein tyrosine phosphatase, partial [uncultured Corynebacteriales bacterium]